MKVSKEADKAEEDCEGAAQEVVKLRGEAYSSGGAAYSSLSATGKELYLGTFALDKKCRETKSLNEMEAREVVETRRIHAPDSKGNSVEVLERNGFLTADELGGEPNTEGIMTPEKLSAMQPYPGVDYLGMV